MKFDAVLKTQKNVIKLLKNSYKKNRLVHTYLFEGGKGTNKLAAAYYFASLILCTNMDKPCFECDECKKVAREIHPSIFLVEPIKGIIRKEQVEILEREFALTSIGEGKRVYIINGIDKANLYAANSLLKFLEELGGENYGILITEQIHNVLSTIKSRSQIVSFGEIPRAQVKKDLVSRGVEELTAAVLSTITNSVDDAFEIIKEGKVIDLIELTRKVGRSLITKDKAPLLSFYENIDLLMKDSQKLHHELFLDLLITYYFDILYYSVKDDADIVFKDDIIELKSYLNNSGMDTNKLSKTIESLLMYKNRLKYNVNVDLYYADLLTEIVR